MDATITNAPVVLTHGAVEAIALEPLGRLAGVSHRVLWREGPSMAGVLKIEAGHHLGRHAHRENRHHIWVVAGRAEILGAELGAGSYVHIPCGVEHDIDARATEGCAVFYVYGHPDG
jgi:quercetin dioxygenase-like cupin family protein